MQTALRLSALQKTFGGVIALRRGDLEVRSGEAHLLLGGNGAGKSTMMKIAAGMVQPDGGALEVHGRQTRFRNPREAQDAGIAMVHQESLLAPHLTVAENLFLGREAVGRFGRLNPRGTLESARLLISRHGIPLDASVLAGALSPAGRQLVEICRALVFDASILIFDEPTSSLSEAEAATVFRIVHNLRRQGRAVIYITHRMDELRRIGDRATVLRDGETVFTALLADITTDCLIEHMAGRAPQAAQPRAARPPGDELFRAENLTRPGSFENVSFTLHEGEVVGLAGLIGAGRTEICRAIFGFDSLASGSMTIQDRPYRPFGPRDAVRAGLALVPEDRQLHGLAASRPLNENMTLASLPGFSPGGILDRKAERGACATMMARLQIRANSTMQRAGELSGGNQQKAVLAKWLLAGARIFLLDEPTRGIDVAAKAEIASLIHDLAGEGAAILLVSSELSELLQLASRIVVLRNGRVAAELPGHTTQEEILRYATLD